MSILTVAARHPVCFHVGVGDSSLRKEDYDWSPDEGPVVVAWWGGRVAGTSLWVARHSWC